MATVKPQPRATEVPIQQLMILEMIVGEHEKLCKHKVDSGEIEAWVADQQMQSLRIAPKTMRMLIGVLSHVRKLAAEGSPKQRKKTLHEIVRVIEDALHGIPLPASPSAISSVMDS